MEQDKINCIPTNDSRVVSELQFRFYPRKGLSQSGRVCSFVSLPAIWMPSLLGPLSLMKVGGGTLTTEQRMEVSGLVYHRVLFTLGPQFLRQLKACTAH